MAVTRRKITPAPDPFVRSGTYTINGRILTAGQTELTIRKLGRCRFHAHVTNPRTGDEWLDVWVFPRGKGAGRWSAAQEEAVTTVHRVASQRHVE